MRLIIDADACPRGVLQSCLELSESYGVKLCSVSNHHHVIDLPGHITVADDSQAADIMIANLCQKGDVVVTQDWGLAALILGKGASCISPGGRVYRAETIDFLMEEREMKARYRRGGNRTKGPKKRSASDDAHFNTVLERLLKGKLPSLLDDGFE